MVRSFLTKLSERRLLALCMNNQDNDHEWNKNAVRYLVRELKKDIKLIDELERAISQQNSKSSCILLPKTPDKRLLVSHRRGLPQVIYCRLWRWPDLQSHHQIRAIHLCESQETISSVIRPSQSNKVCVNPYHYERSNPKPIEPILVPCPKIAPDLSTSYEDSDTTGETKARPGNIVCPHHFGSRSFQPAIQNAPRGNMAPVSSYQNVVGDFGQQETTPQYQQTQQTQQQFPQFSSDHQQQPLQQQQQPLQPPSQPQPQHQQPQTSQQFYQQNYVPPRTQIQQQAQPIQFQDATANQQYLISQEAHYQSQQVDFNQSQEPYNPTQEQHYQQPQEQYPQSQPTTQYQQQYQPSVSQVTSSGVINQQQLQTQEITSDTEIARPYRFKQYRFAHAARARNDHIINRYPSYDQQGYISGPYTYNSQPATHIQVTYQQYRREPQAGPTNLQAEDVVVSTQQSQPQQCSTSGYPPTSADDHSVQYAQQTSSTSSYATAYSSQQHAQYSQQDRQLPMSYQSKGTIAAPTQHAETYYSPGVSSSLDPGVDQPMDHAPLIDIQEVPYTEGTYWCSVSYHEYDQRIGKKYHSNCRVVCIDGYTQPMCSDRFCIGGISNVNRNQFTEWVCRRIGRGIRFTYVDGEVYVESLSESSVFVSNPLLVEEDGDNLIEHVSKLTQGCSAKVFSTQEFATLLTDAVARDFEAVYKLTNRCVIRVSFVKGWGRNYKRQSIYNTPCWVEVQLNGPLQWIDKVLRQMRPPTGCGSTS